MARKKQPQPASETENSKLDLFKEVLANQKKGEKEKQKQIYSAMKGIQTERKGQIYGN